MNAAPFAKVRIEGSPEAVIAVLTRLELAFIENDQGERVDAFRVLSSSQNYPNRGNPEEVRRYVDILIPR